MRLLSFGLLLAACASPVRLYDGPPRDASEVARVYPDEVMVFAVDGVELERDAKVNKRTLELLPGEHTIRTEWSGGATASERLLVAPRGRGAYVSPRRVGILEGARGYYAEFVFTAEAGREYEGQWVPRNDGSGLQQPVIVIRDSGTARSR